MGVHNTRASRKNHPLPTMPGGAAFGGARKGSQGGADPCADQQSPSEPKASRPFATTQGKYPSYTKPPISNEGPSRGEGPKSKYQGE